MGLGARCVHPIGWLACCCHWNREGWHAAHGAGHAIGCLAPGLNHGHHGGAAAGNGKGIAAEQGTSSSDSAAKMSGSIDFPC